MSPRLRLFIFLAAALALVPSIVHIATHMPEFGAHPLPYGEAINHSAVRQRHVTNMVTAVNFDYRGFDTLGEEFMLLTAVTGTVVLLRGGRGEDRGARPGIVPGREIMPRSEAVVLLGRLLGPLVLLFGIYVVIHAQLTPGGGFQGGVIIASGTLMFYLSEGYRGWRDLVRSVALAAAEGGGCLIFALAGLGPMLGGAQFLQNVLPLGRTRALISGGLILIENAGVAFAVAGGFTLLFLEFLEETRAIKAPGKDPGK